MNSVLLAIAAVLVLAFSVLFAVPYFVDWNAYRGVVEEQATGLIGRAVQVGGDVQLALLPTPVIRLENVKVADAEGGFERPFVAARSFTMRLAVPPLLRGVVKARTIDLDRPVVSLGLDDAGAGNWQDIGRQRSQLRFIPKDVGLGSVSIADGMITFAGSPGADPLVLQGVNGKLKARSLQGPYRFEGRLQYRGEHREVHFSTGRREAGGSVRLRGLVREARGRRSYTVDGALRAFAAQPRFDGRFTLRISDPNAKDSASAKLAEPPVELKSQLTAELTRAVFENLELTVRRGGRPQTIAGRLEARWRNGLAVNGNVRGRWFDVDTLLADSGQPHGPATAIPALTAWALSNTSTIRSGRLRVTIEQAVFAGDLIHELGMDLSLSNGSIRVEQLTGRVPGDNRLELKGALRSGETGPAFSGRARLDGQRLSRLVRWAGVEGASLGPADETGAFSIETDVDLDGQRVALENVKGDLLGTAFSGAFRYTTGTRREFVLELDSDRLDLTKVLGPSVSLGAVWDLVARGRSGDDAAASVDSADSWLSRAQARLDLRAGSVVLPGFGEGSLTAKLRFAEGALDVRDFDLRAANGVKLRAEGRFGGIAERPDGKITVVVDAPHAEGLEALATLIELPVAISDGGRLEALAPIKVVATVESSDQETRELKLSVGGTVGGGDVGISGSFKGDVAALGKGRVTLRGTLRNADGKVLIRQIFSNLKAEDLNGFVDGRGLLSVTASGVVESSLDSKVELDAAGLRWAFDGQSIWTDAGFALTGRTVLRAQDAAGALALVGVSANAARDRTPLDLQGQLIKSADHLRIEELKGHVGDQTIDGKVGVKLRDPRPSVNATIAVGEASLSRLLQPTLAWDQTGASDLYPVRAVSVTQSFWPDKRFNLSFLNAFDGRLVLTARRLHLLDAIAVSSATLEANLESGTLLVPRIEGELYGGRLQASARLARRGTGMVFLAKMDAKGVRLERAARTQRGTALATGSVDLEASIGGEGLTPRAIATGLTGEGRLDFGRGIIRRLSPNVLRSFAEPAERGGGRLTDVSPEKLGALVTERLEKAEFPFAPLAAGFVVRNGTAHFEKVTASSEDGSAAINSYLDIAGMRLDSEWVLSIPAGIETAQTPQITLAFAGSLLDLGRIGPDLDTQALERYITMRRMERDVERLEQLDVRGEDVPRRAVSTPERKATRTKTGVDQGSPRPETAKRGRATVVREAPAAARLAPPSSTKPPKSDRRVPVPPAARKEAPTDAPDPSPPRQQRPLASTTPSPAPAPRVPAGAGGTDTVVRRPPPTAMAPPPWQTVPSAQRRPSADGALPPIPNGAQLQTAPVRPDAADGSAQERQPVARPQVRPRPVRRRSGGTGAFDQFTD